MKTPPKGSVNFAFLVSYDPLLSKLPWLAEQYFAEDPCTAIIKLRQFCEELTKQIAAYAGQLAGNMDLGGLIHQLQRSGALPQQTALLLHGLRKAGNAAVHDVVGTHATALHQLKMARQVAIWFHRTYGKKANFKPSAFVPPRATAETSAEVDAELSRLRAELEATQGDAERAAAAREAERKLRRTAEEERDLITQMAAEVEEQLADELARVAQLEALRAEALRDPIGIEQRTKRGREVDEAIELSEADTRRIIDDQLREVGWEVDTQLLHYDRGVRPQKGRNVAIAEWRTSSGPVDYALFCGLRCVGVVEAKRHSADVPAVLTQAKRYARDMVLHDAAEFADGGPWGEYRVPFVYATNGRSYLRQLKTRSGIWFLDVRRTQPSHALPGWHSPDDLLQRLESDIDTAHAQLRTEPMDYLDLRDYQCEAIRKVERAIADERRQVLLAMATGTGKTRTALGLIYRLVKTKRFRRVLFLVDRTSLGEQALGAFKHVKLERLKSFEDIYDIKELSHLAPNKDTKLQVATVQAMVKRVVDPPEGQTPLSTGTYDCIIVDECHRGYNLDREMSEAELEFRDEADYISKYRAVLEHFDAVSIGLTATPAFHTKEIFGKPVFTYSYREAVIDGHLIDYEPPIRIATRLLEDGIGFAAGEEVQAYTAGSTQLDLINMPDEMHFEVEGFHRKVITENFTKTVCAELAKHIDPSLEGKTLIFCVTRAHADQVVAALTAAFAEEYGECDDDVVVRITGDIDRTQEMIRRFRNERAPKVAVTVDLLSTGIDVPKICNIVFLRRVRSRILYEQMLGRATRRCDEIGKEYFQIYDAVDLYAVLERVNSMKPVAANPSFTFEHLATEMRTVKSADARRSVLEQFIAKLHTKARKLAGADLEEFVALAEHEPLKLARSLRAMTLDDATAWFEAHPSVAPLLDNVRGPRPRLLISEHEDELRSVTRGYGDAGRPEDYLEAFKKFIADNLNTMPALVAVTQRPRDLTRASLKELRRQLDGAGYSEAALRTATRETSNVDIAASIVGYIRQQALGAALEPYDERVERAVRRILARRSFTDRQRRWIKQIAKQMKAETIVDRDTMDAGVFRAEAGGFDRINRTFDGQLDVVLGDLREAVWEDVAQ